MTTLGLSVLDNIEGISWGPKLPNGHDSLVLVSDDNFNRNQVTQFLAFEVLPK
ncbi:esterase-like activity of phytase family protein (plasmid) [Bacillus megaterium]|nr:esterase-like activity of phytase family protein [Priestia megaterium]